ncbi:MAG: prepilin peptidase, partial [Burkholderiales bacterium]|nr:prepilin peptidase [Burkholderiales bacterium]
MDILILFENSLLFRLVLLFVVGSCIGSFLNVVIFRLPIILERKWRRSAADILDIQYIKLDPFTDKFNLLIPSSQCFACKDNVPFWFNIPIIGYILSGGKCSKCKAKYSLQYPLVELLTAILFVLTGYFTNDIYLIIMQVIFISIVLCGIFIDFNTFYLPDEITLPLLWGGLLVNLHGAIAGSLIRAVLGCVVGYLLLWSIYWIFKLITKREGMGYGDFKFLAAILAWIGLNGFIPVLFLAPAL